MLFQLSLLPAEGNKSKQLPAGARVTHAGVLEFSAEDGRIGLPLKVRKSLVAEPEETREDGSRGMEERVEGPGGEEGDSRASPAWGSGWKVRVKYVRLEKGTYAKVQPRTGNLWHVPELKGMLEMNLQNHATLSEGDVLQVWYRGRCFDLRVTGLEPTQAVTVIDTDLTVDVEVPEEQTEREREESRLSADAGGVKGQVVGGGGPPPHVSQSCESRGQEAGMEEPSVNSGAKEEERRKRMMATQLSKLAPEPDEGNGDWIALVVRKPDGSMISRRFLRSQPFQDVFRFVEATSVSSDHDPLDMTYRLVTRFPRRVFTVGETAAQSVGEVLGSEAGKRETLMYEACA